MTRDQIAMVIRENISTIIEGAAGQSIEEHHSMRDFGADSLEIVEVVSRSMKQLKIKVRRVELGEAKNFGDLLDLFEAAAKR